LPLGGFAVIITVLRNRYELLDNVINMAYRSAWNTACFSGFGCALFGAFGAHLKAQMDAQVQYAKG
jgi:hypothetical protein